MFIVITNDCGDEIVSHQLNREEARAFFDQLQNPSLMHGEPVRRRSTPYLAARAAKDAIDDLASCALDASVGQL